ncbi:hypothetical protein FOZ63_026584 [Perkinsus olseni]|uniref:Uncharacterized protein n=1 Tax=Perkinsus olseni TaxID=32597 RepID=A0A7J6UII1_PEROL|nr:hypothetical protein FOZ63_026584 [Perkinsus olseni]
MFTFSQPLNQIAPERLDVDGAADAYASGDVTNSQSSLRSLPSSGACVDRSTRLITSLIMTCSGLYIFFNLGLMASKNFIIEGYISRWRMEMRGFDMGPPPVWLNNPPQDFFHLPPDSDKYVNFSLSLVIANDPQWLGVEISDVRLFLSRRGVVHLYIDDVLVNGDGAISITEKIPLVEVEERGYICLHRALITERALSFRIAFGAEFSLLGHKSNRFKLATNLTYYVPGKGSNGYDHRPSPGWKARADECSWASGQAGVSTAAEHHYGEVVVKAASYVPSRAAIAYPSVLLDFNTTLL